MPANFGNLNGNREHWILWLPGLLTVPLPFPPITSFVSAPSAAIFCLRSRSHDQSLPIAHYPAPAEDVMLSVRYFTSHQSLQRTEPAPPWPKNQKPILPRALQVYGCCCCYVIIHSKLQTIRTSVALLSVNYREHSCIYHVADHSKEWKKSKFNCEKKKNFLRKRKPG